MIAFVINNYVIHKETFHNFIWRFLQIFAKQGVSFLIFILCAKFLVPYDFGLYNYILAVIFLIIMFGDLGVSTATSKYVAEYNVTDKEKLRSVLFSAGLIVFVLTTIATVIFLLVGPWFLKDAYVYALYLLPMIFFSTVTSLYDGIYRGLKKFKRLAIISIFVGVISIPIVFFLVKTQGLVGALIAQNIFYIMLLLGLFIGYREFSFKIDSSVIKDIGRYSSYYAVAVLGSYLLIRFVVLLLGYYGYVEEIGVYELITKFFMLMLLPFTLLGQVVAPDFAVMSAKNENQKILLKSVKYTQLFLVVGLLLGLLLYFVMPPLFQIFFYEYYFTEYFDITFLICLVIFVSNVWAATFDAGILIPTGHANMMAKFYIALGIIGVFFSVILANYFGYFGIILSSAILSVIMVIGMRVAYFYKVSKVLKG